MEPCLVYAETDGSFRNNNDTELVVCVALVMCRHPQRKMQSARGLRTANSKLVSCIDNDICIRTTLLHPCSSTSRLGFTNLEKHVERPKVEFA